MKIEDVIKIVDDLNERAFEYGGSAGWAVTAAHGEIWVELMGIPIWDSQEDEREMVGTCEKCGGSGSGPMDKATIGGLCEACGGDGKDDPREDLALFLPREACRIAREIISGCEPKTDSEEPLPHDKVGQ